jgi:hypothetical protein
MHAPLDLDVRAAPDVVDRLEVPQQPATVTWGVHARVPDVYVLRHEW